MINVIKIDTILKEYYKGKSGILVLYYWDWRINRFIRDFGELLKYNKTLNANGIDSSLQYLEFDISNLSNDKDSLDTLIRYLKRYNFKYFLA
jgi:hypothetical protein